VDEELAEAAVQVVNELASNAVEHARTPFRLQVSYDGFLVRVLVRDFSPRPPRINPIQGELSRGLGLRLVDGLCARWSWTAHLDGKTVWAVLQPGLPA
jgi:two-component sensor histidine kinase